MNFETNFNHSRFQQYLDFLKASGTSSATIDRKLSSFKSFQAFLVKKGHIQNQPNSVSFPLSSKREFKGDFKNKSLLARYLLFGTLIAIILGLGYGLYSQTILKAKKDLAYTTATNPIRAGRILSFQGRLTDSAGNPITASTDILFKLYTSGSGGTELYTSSVGNSQTVTPDENGIFSVVIGKSHGTEIPSSVFTENPEVWLEITAGNETMTPRQQIATVGYALNSETLQGLPPSASGLKDTVLVIDHQGNLNLGETSPTIKSTSGIMAIEGQALLLKASDGSGGNITINPDGNGSIRFLTEGTSPSSGGFIDLSNANIAGGNLINSQINNNNRGYNFLSFQNYNVGTTTLSTRFSVNSYGSAYFGAGITTPAITMSTGASNGYILQSDALGNASWVNATTAGIGTSYDVGAGLSRIGNIFSLNLGSTNTWLAPQYFSNNVGIMGNLGIGTTSPTSRLELAGTGSLFRIADSTNNTLVNISDTSAQFNLPTTFTSTGDVSLANNLNFTNTTSSYINSAAPLYLQAGESFNSSDLTLRTYNSGNVVIDSQKLNIGGTLTYSQGAATGYILQTDASGNASWVAPTGIGGTYTASNGINLTGSDFRLGGQLSQNTSINLNSNNFSFSGTGNVGIGTTNPLTALSLGPTNSNIKLSLYDGGNSSNLYGIGANNGALTFGAGVSTTSNPNMVLKSTGNLGIGTTSPSKKLDVAGDINLTGTIFSNGTSGTSGQILSSTGTGLSWINASSVGATYVFNNGLTNYGSFIGLGGTLTQNTNFTIGNTSAFFINGTNGNVGIGTTNPTYKLQISGSNAGVYVNRTGGAEGFILVGTEGTGGQVRGLSGGGLRFTDLSDTNTEYIRFTSSGNVGIGTTSPTQKLDVVGAARISVGITTPQIQLTNVALGTGTTALFIDATGNLTQRSLGSMAFDSGTYDNYQSWNLLTNSTGSTAVTSNATVNFVNGVGISLVQSGSTITINNSGVGTTYTAGVGLTLSNTNVFALNLGSTNVWLAHQIFSGGIGVTGNLTVGGTFISVGSTNLVTRLNAEYLNGLPSTAFLQTGYTGFFNTALNGLSAIGSTGIGLGGTLTQATIINTGSNSLSFLGLGNTQSLFISSSGNVGIGNTNPQTNLLIEKDGSTNADGPIFRLRDPSTNKNINSLAGKIDFESRDAGYANVTSYIQSRTYDWGSNWALDFGVGGAGYGAISTTKMTILASGNVGIGTTNPGAKLEILSIGSSVETLRLTASDPSLAGGPFMSFYSATGIKNWAQIGSGPISNGSGDKGYLSFSTRDSEIVSEKIRINNAGNLGIGTISPTQKLDVNGSVNIGGSLAIGSIGSTSDNNRVLTSSTAGSGIAQYLDTTSWDKNSGDDYSSWLLQSNGANTASVGTGTTVNFVNGVGISLSQSGSTITINNSGVGTTYAAYNGIHLTAQNQFGLGGTLTQNTNLTIGNTSAFFINATSGYVGLGTTNPSTLLELSGTITTAGQKFTVSSYKGYAIAFGSSLPTWVDTSSPNARIDSVGNFVFNSGTSGDNYFNYDNRNTRTNYFEGTNYFNHWNNAKNSVFEGSVGIGITSPTNPLHVYSNANGVYTQRIFNDSATAGHGLLIRTDGTGNDSYALTVQTGSYDPIFRVYGDRASFENLSIGTGYLGSTPISNGLAVEGNVGIGTTSPTQKLDVVGAARISVGITTPLIQLTNVAVGTGTTALFIDATGNLTKRALGTMAFDSGTYDNYQSWNLLANSTGSTAITSNANVNFVNGVGISLVQSGSTITVNNTGTGTTYAAGSGLSLISNVFSLGGTLTQNTNLTIGNTSAFFINATSGYVGLGTNNPGAKLEVTGGSLLLSDPNFPQLKVDSSQHAAIYLDRGSTSFTNQFRFLTNGAEKWRFGETDSSENLTYTYFNGTWHDALTLQYNTGNVGIGTISPTQKLDVNGSVNIGGSLAIGSIGSTSDNNRVLTSSALGSGIAQYIDTTSWDKNSGDDYSSWLLQSNGANTASVGTGTTVNFVNGVGISLSQSGSTITINNSGIGTTYAAGSGLSLISNVFSLGGTLTQNTNLTIGNTSAFFINGTSGNVGIGTTNPNGTLEVHSNTTYGQIVVSGTNSGTNTQASILLKADTWGRGTGLFTHNSATNSNWYLGNPYNQENVFVINKKSSATFDEGTANSIGSGVTNLLYINANNFVGIGTTSPTQKLDVVGAARISVGITTPQIQLTNVALGTGTTALFIDATGNLTQRSLGSMAFDSGTYDNYQSWNLLTNSTGSTAVTSNATVNFVNGVGISLVQSGSTITINNSGVGTTYAAGSGLTLASNVFSLGGTLTQNTNFTIGNTSAFFINSTSGNVGIGTSNPTSKLEVNGNITLSSGGGQTITTAGTELILQQTGDTYGTTKLRLQNRNGVNGAVFENSNIDLVDFKFSGTSHSMIQRMIGTGVWTNYLGSPEFWFTDNTGINPSLVVGSTNVLARNNFFVLGNVGLGTTNPLYQLDMTGSLRIGGTFISVGSTNLVTNLNADLLDGYHANNLPYDSYNNWQLQSNGASTTAIGSGTTVNFVNGVGISLVQSGSTITVNNTGVGTTYSAGSGLTLASNIISLGGTLTQNTNLTIGNTSAFFINSTSGNVGIGTTSPAEKLEINGMLKLNSGAATDKIYANNTDGLIFESQGGAQGTVRMTIKNVAGMNGALFENVGVDLVDFGFQPSSGSSSKQNIRFEHRTGAVYPGNTGGQFEIGPADNENLYIGNVSSGFLKGNVGIGTTSPTQKLDINGSLNIGGSMAIGSTQLVTNLNADLLDGNHASDFVGIGATGNFLTSLSEGIGISLSGTGVGRTIALSNTTVTPGTYGAGTSIPTFTVDAQGRLTSAGSVALPAGTSYTASNGVTLVANDFQINHAYANTWTATQTFANVGIGATLSLTGLGTTISDTNLLLSLDASNNVRQINTSTWDKNTADDYSSWFLQSNSANTTSIGTGTTVNFVNGVGISLAQSGSTITINNTSVGTTYTAGVGLTLSSANVFSLNLGSTNVWLAPQIFNGGIGVTGNLAVGGTFISVGSTNLVTNLNANYLNGHSDTYFLDLGDTAAFIQSLTNGGAISITGTGIGRTLAIDYNTTNLRLTANQLNTIQNIDVSAQPTFARLGIGSTSSLYALNVGGTTYTNNLYTSGNVGIGTTNPLGKLHIQGTPSSGTRVVAQATGTETADFADFDFYNSDGNIVGAFRYVPVNGGNYGGSNSINFINVLSAPLTFGTNNTVRMTIDSLGNLSLTGAAGIGSSLSIGTIPSISDNNLVLTSNSGIVSSLNTTNWDKSTTDDLTSLTAGIGITITGTGNSRTIAFDGSQVGNMTFGSGSTFSWTFNAGSTQNFINFNNGNVGIGATNPRTALEVNGTIAAQKFVDLTGYDTFFIDLANSDYNSSSMQLDRRGSIKWNALYNSGWRTIDNGYASKIENGLDGLLFATSIGNTTASSSITGWNQNLFLASTGNVGIGTTNPSAKLEITATGSTDLYGVKSTVSLADGDLYTQNQYAGYFHATSTGTLNNSYGVYAVSDATDVNSDSIGVYGQGINAGIYGTSDNIGVNAYSTNTGISTFGNIIGIQTYANSASGYGIYTYNQNANGYALYSSQGKNYFSGNVGIGGTNPRSKLDVLGTLTVGGTQNVGLQMRTNTDLDRRILFTLESGTYAKGTLNGDPLVFEISGSEAARFNSSGYLGIGTTSPLSTLSVGGSGVSGAGIYGIASTYGLYGVSTSGSGYGVRGYAESTGTGVFGSNNSSTGYGVMGTNTSSGIGAYFSSTSGHALITGNGNVGIGTATPLAKLHIEGVGVSGLVFIKNTQTGYTAAALTIQNSSTSIGVTGGEFVRFLNSSGTKVGRIRTNALASSVSFATSAVNDFAEYVHGDEPSQPMDLIAFHGDKYGLARQGEVVAGTHSNIATYIGNENIADEPNSIPLTLVGIVDLKVNSENGPISPGDPISTSSVAGVGAKAISRGRIVGHAIEEYTNTDKNQIGQIKILVQPTYYDPDLNLTDTGEVNVNYNVSSEVLSSLGYVGAKNEIEAGSYTLSDSTGKIVTRISQFAKLAAAKIETGLLTAKSIIVDNLAAKKIASETIITGDITATTATVSGTLTTDKLSANEATISTLYADNIISKDGSFQNIFAEKISSLRDEIKNIIAQNQSEATPSAIMADASTWDTSLATDSANLDLANLTISDNLVIGAQLIVSGNTKLDTASVQNTLTVGQIAINSNIIETAATDLYIQPSALATIHFLNDRLVLSPDGNVTINGNLNVSGSLIANLLSVKDIQTETLTAEKINVATISALPNVAIADASTVSATATSSATVATNATAGSVTLSTGSTEIIIENSRLTPNSMVYLTPNASTQNQVLYVKNKNDTSFTIAIDQALDHDIDINWWLIN